MATSNNAATSRVASLFVAAPELDRHNNINLMRFIAAAAVIGGHMAIFVGASPLGLFGKSVSTVAVYIFFVLSGYLICESLQRDGNPFRYLVRRVLRIFPALVAVVAASVFVLGPLMSTLGVRAYFASPQTWDYLVHNCMMAPRYNLPGVFEGNPYPNAVNGSLWTLPIEFAMYLVLPCVLFVFKRLGVGRAGMLGCAVATGLLTLLYEGDVFKLGIVVHGVDLDSAFTLVPFFFVGAYVALTPGLKERPNLQAAFVMLLVLGVTNIGSSPFYTALSSLVLMVFLPYVVFAFAFAAPAVFGRVFAEHDYSYGVYLWGFPVQQTLVALLGAGALGVFAYTLVSLAVTLVFAMLSWFLVERPANRLGKRVTAWSRSREKARAAQPR